MDFNINSTKTDSGFQVKYQ